MNVKATIARPLSYRSMIGGYVGVIKDSTSMAQIVLTDLNLSRITTAVITLSIVRPDTGESTVTTLSVPHVGNGVYRVTLPTTAVPVVGYNYQAQWIVTSGSDVQKPTTYFDVYAA